MSTTLLDSGVMRRAAILMFVVGACGSDPSLPQTGQLAVDVPVPGSIAVTSIELDVLDEFALCEGPAAAGGSVLAMRTLEPGASASLSVTAGARVFHAVALDAAMPVAEGCERVFLNADETRDIRIDLIQTTGGADAGVDAQT
jgi:hypothetical protein